MEETNWDSPDQGGYCKTPKASQTNLPGSSSPL